MMMGEVAAHLQQSAEGDDAYALLAALRRYLPSNDSAAPYEEEEDDALTAAALDTYACDRFWMYEFKVRRCLRWRSHDWTNCPFAHRGRRRAAATRVGSTTPGPRARTSARAGAGAGTVASSRTGCSSASSTRRATAHSPV
jgi:hypothetical protein